MKNSRRLDFRTTVDWHENHRMLRVDFPLEIKFDNVRCEQGGGFIRRSALRNTISERHAFEFAAQRCIIAGDGINRAALMSDCKYAYKAYNNSFGINLLRSPHYPDEVTDRGIHEFCYSFMVFDSSRGDAEARESALTLNRPPMMLKNSSGTIPSIIAQVNIPGVTVEALKNAEDNSQIKVLRLVEQYGNSVSGQLQLHGKYQLVESDLQENAISSWSN